MSDGMGSDIIGGRKGGSDDPYPALATPTFQSTWETCPQCGGAGKIGTIQNICFGCGGWGKIPKESK